MDATVDFVFSGSRLKLFVPKETCLITFLIGGIECPRTERPRRDGKPGMEPGKYLMITSDFGHREDAVRFKDIRTEVLGSKIYIKVTHVLSKLLILLAIYANNVTSPLKSKQWTKLRFKTFSE